MKRVPYHDEIIWIIGASSGIGEALAKELASRGATLALSARNKEALDALSNALGEQHKSFALDVTDAKLLTRTAQAIRASFGRIDRVIFLAAAYTPMKLDKLDLAITKQMLDVNLLGAFHTIHAVLPILAEQSSGQLALCGSVAGYIGLPGGQPYSATKAGIMNIAQSLKNESPKHVDIKLISPGFVRTGLTAKNDFPMPMIITPEKAASYIAEGLSSQAFELHFPKRFTYGVKLLNLLPQRLGIKIAGLLA